MIQPLLRYGLAALAITPLLACSTPAPCTADYAPESVTVTLERSACMGQCPTWQATIHGDGRVDYVGSANVPFLGEHQGRLDPAAMCHLVTTLRASGLDTMHAEYGTGVADAPTATLTVDLDGGHTSVRRILGGPPALRAAIATVDSLVLRHALAEG